MMLRRQVQRAYRPLRAAKIVVGFCLAALALAAVGSRVLVPIGRSNADLSRLLVDKAARELAPRWLVTHPESACPTRHDIFELDEDSKDTWGHPIEITCDARGHVYARSAGEDGVMGTSDDVTSR